MSETSPMMRTNPIQIKTKTNQYSLNTMPFDPTQNSPPSLWKIRLSKRLGVENKLKTSITHVLNNSCIE
jgi:hypothetical protein